MYVDKPLTGVTAVQTLSRLNRIDPMKSEEDVHVLDFVNTGRRHSGGVRGLVRDHDHRAERPEPALRQAARGDGLRAAGCLGDGGVHPGAGSGRTGTDAGCSRAEAARRAARVPEAALDRFDALETDDEREGFRGRCRTTYALYSLIAQIVDWGDRDLERLYQYGRILLIRLPGRPSTSVDIGDADLSHFRLEFTGQHNVSLSCRGGIAMCAVTPLTAAVTGSRR